VEALTKPRVYVETSVFGNFFDEKSIFHKETRQLFDAIAAGKFTSFTSDYVFLNLTKLLMKPKEIIRPT
jgi:predicted nucleic acid-binding protein